MSSAPTPVSSPVRLRFAPSPTGFLHIGGVRAALYNWLYARHYGGTFLLRIEDTDLERSEERFTQDIMASLKWLGLSWDEEVIFQSKRLDVYRQKAEELIAKGLAYKCWSTEEELEAMRAKAMAEGKKPMYDRTWRDRTTAGPADKPYVIRAKIPLEGSVTFHDMIRGDITVSNTEIDDFVLIRSNGAPTYNMSCVVDDVHQRMTHVVRGDDHINNTPKQLHLYTFFGFPVPQFAHLPMILGADKKKLSKRHGAVSANQYREDGFLPEAMLNFLARIGWSHGDQEVFTVAELKRFFGFDHVQKASGVFNTEKLLWVNGEHIRRSAPERLAEILLQDFAPLFAPPASTDLLRSDLGVRLITLIQPKVKTLKELAEQLVPLATPGVVAVDASGLKWNKNPELKAPTQAGIREVIAEFSKRVQTPWQALSDAGLGHEEIDAYLRGVGEKHGLKLGDFVGPMRLWVSGRAASASLFDLMSLLPWSEVAARLKAASEA